MRLPLSSKISVRSGMTIVEIATVIAIISTLSTLSFFAFSSAKKFADRIASQADIAKNQALANSGKTGTLTTVAMSAPIARPLYVPGEYYISFSGSVSNPVGDASRLASLVGGQVGDIFNLVTPGFILYVNSQDLSRLSTDPAVKQIDPVPFVYPCAVPMNIQRVYSNGMASRQDTATGPTATIFGVPTTRYRQYRNTTNTAGQALITGRLPVNGSTGATIAVGVMDTGIDKTHPDLFVVKEFDFTNNGNPADNDGHGTHIAGVVGALDRSAGAGVVGVYPGAPLVNMKVMGSPFGGSSSQTLPFGSAAAVYLALDFLVLNPGTCRVCLMAFQTGVNDNIMNLKVDAASNAGVLMIAPSGNRNFNPLFDSFGGSGNVSPAAANQAVVIGAIVDTNGRAGGSAPDDSLAPYSNTNNVDFMAPGGYPNPPFSATFAIGASYAITSTIPLAGQAANLLANPYSENINGTPNNNAFGTSFAAAHAAGMFAYVLDPQTTIGFVVGNAIPTFRFGIINRATAVTNLTNLTHNLTKFQMKSPIAPFSAWTVSAGTPKVVAPYSKTLHDDTVRFDFLGVPLGGANQRPILNFYQNPQVAPTLLLPFPG